MKLAEKRMLLRKKRERLQTEWVAESGSPEEKQILRNWQEYTPNTKDKELIAKWIKEGEIDPYAMHNEGYWWATAKRVALGSVAYETALKRHENLSDREWIVACLLARGLQNKDIAPHVHIEDRTVEDIIKDIKEIIEDEYQREITLADSNGSRLRVAIAKWFFGI